LLKREEIREHSQKLRDVARRAQGEDVTDLRSRARASQSPGAKGDSTHTASGAEPVIDFEVGDDPEAVPVRVAWARVMRFCRALSKGSTAKVVTKGGGSYEYKYRGVDDVVSLAGAGMREFGVIVMPAEIKTEYRAGNPNWCAVEVTYAILSINSDDPGYLKGVARGEAFDFGDKATVKAEQQAFRVFLTTALSLPTYDVSMDTDATPVMPTLPSPTALRDEMLQPNIEVQRLLAIRGELQRDAQAGGTLAVTKVPVPDGQGGEAEESLWDLNTRRGKERQGGGEHGQHPIDQE
jgi:hypothetical protein